MLSDELVFLLIKVSILVHKVSLSGLSVLGLFVMHASLLFYIQPF